LAEQSELKEGKKDYLWYLHLGLLPFLVKVTTAYMLASFSFCDGDALQRCGSTEDIKQRLRVTCM
jgi:hypothetical protein